MRVEKQLFKIALRALNGYRLTRTELLIYFYKSVVNRFGIVRIECGEQALVFSEPILYLFV